MTSLKTREAIAEHVRLRAHYAHLMTSDQYKDAMGVDSSRYSFYVTDEHIQTLEAELVRESEEVPDYGMYKGTRYNLHKVGRTCVYRPQEAPQVIDRTPPTKRAILTRENATRRLHNNNELLHESILRAIAEETENEEN